MQFEMRRGIVAGCALIACLLPACTGVTEITAPVEETDEPAELALVDEEANEPVVDDTAQTATDPVGTSTDPVDTGEADDWAEWDINGFYTIEVPWTMDESLWFDSDLDRFVKSSQERGLEFPRALVTEWDKILKTPQGIMFFGEDGDSIVAHRTFGTANALINHEAEVERMRTLYDGFADDVDLSSEPRRFGETPGILVRGTYDIEGERWYHYGFQTHAGAHLYYVTVALIGEDDPDMVTKVFRSLVIDS